MEKNRKKKINGTIWFKAFLFASSVGLALFLILQSGIFNKAIADKKIAIQVYFGFNQSLADKIKVALENTYGCSVQMLETKPLPEWAFVNIKSPRYRADSLLLDLKRTKPDGIDHVLGLSVKDISTTKKDVWGRVKEPIERYQDWGVFGLGYRPGPACVISTFRLHRSPQSLFESRVLKVSIHEIGHNLGLKHCETSHCVMADAAEKLSTVDQVEAKLCEKCRRQINLEDSSLPSSL